MSEKYTTERPDWVPEDADCKFTTSVMGGIEGIKDLTVGNINPKLLNGTGMPRRKLVLSEDDYVAGVERGDRMTLSRAITLIESNSSKHFKLAQRVLQRLLPRTGNALRIGITGVPGAGKSTMIEAFGNMLCDAGHRVAVLTVDPTSSVTKGSILGDKTRMGTLSRRPDLLGRANVMDYLEDEVYLGLSVDPNAPGLAPELAQIAQTAKAYGLARVIAVPQAREDFDAFRNQLSEVPEIKCVSSVSRMAEWAARKKHGPLLVIAAETPSGIPWMEAKRQMVEASGPALILFGAAPAQGHVIAMRPQETPGGELPRTALISATLDRFFGSR